MVSPATVLMCVASFLQLSFAQSSSAQASANRSAIYARGVSALQHRDLNTAREAFEKVVKLSPRNADAQNYLGWVLLAQGEVENAIPHFRAALAVKPKLAQAHINLASALEHQGKLPDAATELRLALKISPLDVQAHRGHARRRRVLEPLVLPLVRGLSFGDVVGCAVRVEDVRVVEHDAAEAEHDRGHGADVD